MSCSKSIRWKQKESQTIVRASFFSGEGPGQLLPEHDAICLLGSGVYLTPFSEWLFTLDLPSGASPFMSMSLSLLKKNSQSLKVSEQGTEVLLNILRHAP